jgi:hypothetical protein
VKQATRKQQEHGDDPIVRDRPRIGGAALWFAVFGGVAAWSVQLFISWSVMEISCIGPARGGVYQRAGTTVTARIVAYAGTAVPWLVAVAALLTCLLLHTRMRRLGADLLAGERTKLLLVLGFFLDAMTIAIITAGGIALALVRAC